MYQLPQLGNNKSISKCSTSYKRTLEKCKNLQNITKNTVLTLKSNHERKIEDHQAMRCLVLNKNKKEERT